MTASQRVPSRLPLAMGVRSEVTTRPSRGCSKRAARWPSSGYLGSSACSAHLRPTTGARADRDAVQRFAVAAIAKRQIGSFLAQVLPLARPKLR